MSDLEEKDETSPELKDLFEMISRYTAANKNNVIFVGGFVGFTKGHCPNCDDTEGDIPDDNKSRFFAYGDIDSLRLLLNDLRDMVEEEKDDDGFINI